MNLTERSLSLMDKPQRVTIEGDTIRWNWYRAASLAMGVVALVWIGISCGVLYSASGAMAAVMNTPLAWPILIVPFMFVACSLWIAYMTLALFINHTVVTIIPNVFSIQHGPLPWRGVRPVDPATIEEIWIQEYRFTKGARPWRLKARLASGRKLTLLWGMESREHGAWFQQVLESQLGLNGPRKEPSPQRPAGSQAPPSTTDA